MTDALPDQPMQDAWTAVEMTDFAGLQRHIRVNGTIVAVLTDRIFLEIADPLGSDAADLVERRLEPFGGDAMGQRSVRFAHDVALQRYRTVTVRRHGKVAAHVQVDEGLSLTGR